MTDAEAMGDTRSRSGRASPRVRSAKRAALCFLVGTFSWLALLTVGNLYHGTGVVKTVPHETPAVAQVGACRRVGPVSPDGFGYWWHCDAVVTTAAGRFVRTTVGRSILTPSDAGTTV